MRSERATACRLVGLSCDSRRNPPGIDAITQKLSRKIVEIAHVRRRFGYRRIHDMLRPHFPDVDHKKVCRLYSAAILAVRRRNTGRRIKCLTVADEFSHECVRLPTGCAHGQRPEFTSRAFMG
ncbi:putative transposase [Variovorax sp. OK212]|nr:HTH-like domain-containing protein [Variovorax sp. OK202]SFE77374.1 putative transposase [Variovorax sp. OK212]